MTGDAMFIFIALAAGQVVAGPTAAGGMAAAVDGKPTIDDNHIKSNR
jgi:hypothetical protein